MIVVTRVSVAVPVLVTRQGAVVVIVWVEIVGDLVAVGIERWIVLFGRLDAVTVIVRLKEVREAVIVGVVGQGSPSPSGPRPS